MLQLVGVITLPNWGIKAVSMSSTKGMDCNSRVVDVSNPVGLLEDVSGKYETKFVVAGGVVGLACFLQAEKIIKVPTKKIISFFIFNGFGHLKERNFIYTEKSINNYKGNK